MFPSTLDFFFFVIIGQVVSHSVRKPSSQVAIYVVCNVKNPSGVVYGVGNEWKIVKTWWEVAEMCNVVLAKSAVGAGQAGPHEGTTEGPQDSF